MYFHTNKDEKIELSYEMGEEILSAKSIDEFCSILEKYKNQLLIESSYINFADIHISEMLSLLLQFKNIEHKRVIGYDVENNKHFYITHRNKIYSPLHSLPCIEREEFYEPERRKYMEKKQELKQFLGWGFNHFKYVHIMESLNNLNMITTSY